MMKLSMAAIAVLLVAAPVQAQSHQHGEQAGAKAAGHECPMHQGEGMNHAADPAHRYMPKMIIGNAEMLKLTPDQITKLEAMLAESN